jgi:hypothetical protein
VTNDETSVKTLSLLVLSTESEQVVDATEIREAGPITAIKSLFVGRKDVPLEKIDAELTRVQGEIDNILAKVEKDSRQGFKLSEVEISLGLSAGGSIGVVTAGIEAGITLHFAKA